MKVAFVIISVAEALGTGDEEPFLDRVASAIDRLVTSGKLESWGDISDWRHSELKLAEPRKSDPIKLWDLARVAFSCNHKYSCTSLLRSEPED